MFELRWFGTELQYRQRNFVQDASGALCGMTKFGPWQAVPHVDRTVNAFDRVDETSREE